MHALLVALEGGRVQPIGRYDEGELTLRVIEEIGQVEFAAGLLRAPLPDRQQTGQPTVGLPVGGIDQEARRPVGEVETAAGQVADLRCGGEILPGPPGAHAS